MRFPDLLLKIKHLQDELALLNFRVGHLERDLGDVVTEVRRALPEAQQYLCAEVSRETEGTHVTENDGQSTLPGL